MRIETSAPTRIDLAGGTIDIWPLYLFHAGAQTINAAISVRARARLESRTDTRIVLRSEDTGVTVEADDPAALRREPRLRLLSLLAAFFSARGITLTTTSESPTGAGLAGSSALNVAVCAALAEWKREHYEPEALLQVAMNVEAQTIQVPTGLHAEWAARVPADSLPRKSMSAKGAKGAPRVLVIPVEEQVDFGLKASLERALEEAKTRPL